MNVYINGLLVLTKVYWTDHIQKLELALNKLKERGLKFNIQKYFFRQTKEEYLGFCVTRNGVIPLNKNLRQ